MCKLIWTKWSPFWQRQFQIIFWNKYDKILSQISLKFVPRGPINNKPALVQVKAWRQTDKQLPQLMLTQFTDAYM